VENNAKIGKEATLHPHVYIGHSCEIGSFCEIMPQAVIGSEGFGYAHDEKGNHFRIPHTGKVVLEDDVHIGAGTAIDRGTIEDSVIGRGTKIDNQVHLAHNTVVGKNGLITAQCVTAGSSQIGDNFICGGKTAITGHIKVTDNVNVAGFSAISNNVKEGGQYGGYPLVPLKQHLKIKASSVHLPELRKQMNRVLRKLFPEDYL
jgi:UDP-3-O-[3-hydroxymyristoyl] glucosamine N-acyltransferase